jgi:hypothetical protein
VIGAVIVLVLVAIGAAAWAISTSLHGGTATATGGSHPPTGTSSSAPATTATVLKISSASSYNVEDSSGPGNTEDPSRASLAIDGNPSTAWATSYYFGKPNFGGLKPGAGLILNMGRPVKLSQVEVLFGTGGTSASIYVGNNGALTKAAFSTFTKVGSESSASGDYKFDVSSSATGQYVVVWLTNLPPSLPSSGNPANTYQGLIYEVTVRGTTATSAG